MHILLYATYIYLLHPKYHSISGLDSSSQAPPIQLTIDRRPRSKVVKHLLLGMDRGSSFSSRQIERRWDICNRICTRAWLQILTEDLKFYICLKTVLHNPRRPVRAQTFQT